MCRAEWASPAAEPLARRQLAPRWTRVGSGASSHIVQCLHQLLPWPAPHARPRACARPPSLRRRAIRSGRIGRRPSATSAGTSGAAGQAGAFRPLRTAASGIAGQAGAPADLSRRFRAAEGRPQPGGPRWRSSVSRASWKSARARGLGQGWARAVARVACSMSVSHPQISGRYCSDPRRTLLRRRSLSPDRRPVGKPQWELGAPRPSATFPSPTRSLSPGDIHKPQFFHPTTLRTPGKSAEKGASEHAHHRQARGPDARLWVGVPVP